jgi:hypothetical protein
MVLVLGFVISRAIAKRLARLAELPRLHRIIRVYLGLPFLDEEFGILKQEEDGNRFDNVLLYS